LQEAQFTGLTAQLTFANRPIKVVRQQCCLFVNTGRGPWVTVGDPNLALALAVSHRSAAQTVRCAHYWARAVCRHDWFILKANLWMK